MVITPHQREMDTTSQPQLTRALFPSYTTTHEVSATSPATPVTVAFTQGVPPRRHQSLEGHILELLEQAINSSLTTSRGPSQPQELTTPALVGFESPPDLEADLALSNSTDSDNARSVQEEILQLHREAGMSPGERAKTVIKTVWPIDLLFSSPEDRNPEEPQSNRDEGSLETPASVFPEISDKGTTLLVPYSPSDASSPISNTVSSSHEDPGSQESTVADATS